MLEIDDLTGHDTNQRSPGASEETVERGDFAGGGESGRSNRGLRHDTVRDAARSGTRRHRRCGNESGDPRRAAEAGRGIHGGGAESIPFFTVFGPIEVTALHLRNRVTKESFRPTQDRLRLSYRGRSLGVERALTDFGAEESFGRAATRFAEHYGYEIGRTTILRVVEERAVEAEVYVAEHLASEVLAYNEPLKTRPGIECILTEMDGCEIRTGTLRRAKTRKKTAKRKLPKKQRVEAWRDVRLAFVRDLHSVDKTYVGGLRSFDDVGSDMFAAAVSRGLSSKTKVIGVADGGNGIREQMESKFVNLQFILDRPHLKHHLYETADAIGHKNKARESWVSSITELCETGNSKRAIAKLRRHKGRGKSSCLRLSNYLNRFSDAVHYQAYRKAGYPTGSGEIESGHRVVPQKRLKIPGACWHPNTINPMMALRIMRENGWWKNFWNSRAA